MMLKPGGWLLLGGLALALALAAFVSPFASSSPDGLERVAADAGFLEKAGAGEKAAAAWRFSPLPDYAVPGVKSDRLATGLAGLAGVALVFAVGWGVGRLVARRTAGGGPAATPPTEGADG